MRIVILLSLQVFLSLSLVHAQVEDVTSDYLSNATFDENPNYLVDASAENLVTSDNGTSILAVDGWDSFYSGWSASATFEYGFNGQFNSFDVPEFAFDGETTGTGNASFGVCAAWGGMVKYTQQVTLPAGTYVIEYNVYNGGTATTGTSLVGWIPEEGDAILSNLNSFTSGEWTVDKVMFVLSEETTGDIQLGVQAANAGSSSNARLFIDDLKLQYVDAAYSSDATLSNITLSDGTLVPEFSSDEFTYSVMVPAGVTSIDVTPELSNANATLVGGGTIEISTSGLTNVEIEVTAENTLSKNTYLIQLISGTNLLTNWDGNDATGAGSEPNNFGWDCSPSVTAWAEANVFGIRFQDDVTINYQGASITQRVLYLRWDGTGGASTGSVYSFPVTVESCKTYHLTGKIAWIDNANSPNYHFEINSEKNNSGTVVATQEVLIGAKKESKAIDLVFTPKEAGTYYFTVGCNSGVLGAITDLELYEYSGEPFIQTSTEKLVYDSIQLSNSFVLNTYGLTEDITFIAPEGMTISPETVSATDANCGLELTATFDSKTSLTAGTLQISSGDYAESINLIEILPPYIVPGTGVFTDDGTWCWFQDPRALSFEGTTNKTYSGWITSKGKVQAASFDHKTGEIISNTISPDNFMQVDDHNNPTFLMREDGRLLVAYSGHFYGPMRVIVSTNPEDVSSFGPEANFGNNVTYANPYQIGDSTVMFYRDGNTWHPTINVSMDGGLTWGTPKELITRNGNQQRPYVKYTQDKSGGIHMIFTTGHPRQEANNKVYYTYFKDNKFYRADGTLLKNFATQGPLNIDAGEVETIYDASKGKGWTWDIALDKDENPVVLYAAFPDDLNHHYYYGIHKDGKWTTNHIVNSGRWFPQTPEGGNEPEPNYSGGMTLDPNDPSVVYLSKQVNGIFEIFKYTTDDDGATWETEALTANTPEGIINVRPIVPRGHKPGSFDVMWLRGTYVTYANYLTKVMYYSPNSLEAKIDSIQIDGVIINKFEEEVYDYKVDMTGKLAKLPTVAAFSSIPNTTIEIEQVNELPGTATIKVTSDGGVVSKTYTVKITGIVSAKSNPEMGDVIYPNPIENFIKFNLNTLEHAEKISIFDAKGSIVLAQDVNKQIKIDMPVAHFKKGVYLVKVDHAGGTFQKKVMKL